MNRITYLTLAAVLAVWPAVAHAGGRLSFARAVRAHVEGASPAMDSALAQIGKRVALTPDQNAEVVSTQVGSDRWAITVDLGQATPLVIVGNVLQPNGAVLLWCKPTGVRNWDGQNLYRALIDYDCYAAVDSINWGFVSAVTLPGSFFLP